MEQQVLDRLNKLIKNGEALREGIKYVPEPKVENYLRMPAIYKHDNPLDYEEWIEFCGKFMSIYAKNDLSTFIEYAKKITPYNHIKIISLLKSISKYDIITSNQVDQDTHLINVSNNHNQYQTQSQKLIFSIFNEAIKDELTGKQMKEIQEIIESYQDKPEESKTKIWEKLKSFGSDTISNILANIIINSNIRESFLK